MSRVEVLEKIKELLIENNKDISVDVSTINEESQLVRDLGFDSLKMIYSVVVIEQNFNCKINNDDYKKVITIGDLIDLIIK